MSQTTIDLTAPTTPALPPPAPRLWPIAVPWALVGLLLLLLAAAVRSPIPKVEAVPSPVVDPVVVASTPEGWSDGLTVWRDPAGVIVGASVWVLPFAGPAWCQLTVDGLIVARQDQSDPSADRSPAVCVWVRSA